MTTPTLPTPVGGELLFVSVTLSGIAAALFIYWDARKQGATYPGLMAICVGFLFLLYFVPGVAALVLYLILRGSIGQDEEDTEAR